ncbi:sulfatase-like hydrolase/transferase [Paenibacillus sp. HB172176]|uniref:sulfatase-like hydrolase/transferase n=1 Tax=Paenibacillus sp. HB172176 TaxID=2493690 RepID=UPI00143B7C8F|nr:sulfatase-like hydrolase/transferase [Paenibacillus sp. HB172176]
MKKRPHILLYMTDQQNADTIGERGLCHTPHLNRLMKDGVTFASAFTNCPMCTPARATALTGLHPHQHKLIQNSHSHMAFVNKLDPETETLGTALRREGYHTVYAGKWHIGSTGPEEHGFAEKLHLAKPAAEPEITPVVTLKKRYGDEVLAGTTAEWEHTESFRLSAAVSDWLDRRSDEDDPFFLFASCIEPHVPWIAPKAYSDKYNPELMQEWDNFRDDYRDKPTTFTKHGGNANFCRMNNDWDRTASALSCYYGTVTMLDEAFGSIVDKLKEKGLFDDTVIIFTSDHGELMGRHGLVGKNELALEDLIRIPLVMYWKGHFMPGVCESFITLTDLFNTVMELADAPRREQLDSLSYVPCLRGERFKGREEVFVEHHGATVTLNVVRAVRTGRFKYVFRVHEVDELYDLANDPQEMTNLFRDPAYRETVWEMRGKLLAWAEETDDFALNTLRSFFDNPELDAFV